MFVNTGEGPAGGINVVARARYNSLKSLKLRAALTIKSHRVVVNFRFITNYVRIGEISDNRN